MDQSSTAIIALATDVVARGIDVDVYNVIHQILKMEKHTNIDREELQELVQLVL